MLKNTDGRALIAQVHPTPDGPALKLDLTGYADGSCHAVMDDVLQRLSDKGIRLFDMNRRSHYRREGVLATDAQRSQTPDRATSMSPPARGGERDRRRRAAIVDAPVRQTLR